jgi:hypothetical protein
MEKKTIKSPVDNLPKQNIIKIQKSKSVKHNVEKSKYIDNNLDSNFLNKYFQEPKK